VKVLYVNHTSLVSGSEHSLLNLLGGLPATVSPCVATPPGRLAQTVQQLGIPVTLIASTAGSLRLHPLHTPRAIAELGGAALQVRRAARRHRADVVHANTIRAGIEVGLARVPAVASVVHVRDCLPMGTVTTASVRLAVRTASAVVAVSRYAAERVRVAAPGAPIEVINPTIDVSRFDPSRVDRLALRARLGPAAGRGLVMGVVAQLTPWKGQDTAIEALALLRRQGVDAHLLLIGSAKFVAPSTRLDNRAYVARLRALVAATGAEDRVSWLGERRDVRELVPALDMLLLPSRDEPFGRALLEAMALEVPVLASSEGGATDLVRDGSEGFLLPPGEPAAWAAAARRIAETPGLGRKLGRAGRLRVTTSFDRSLEVARILEIYDRATRQPGSDRRSRAAERSDERAGFAV